jgi:hypothetical protein
MVEWVAVRVGIPASDGQERPIGAGGPGLALARGGREVAPCAGARRTTFGMRNGAKRATFGVLKVAPQAPAPTAPALEALTHPLRLAPSSKCLAL